jgi:hypothetical protein
MRSHAEADRADLAGAHLVAPGQVRGGARDVLGRLVHGQAHHELAGLVRLGRLDAVVEIGGQREVALSSEAVDHIADVADQSPPLLDDDDRGPVRVVRNGEIALAGPAVAREAHHVPHSCLP